MQTETEKNVEEIEKWLQQANIPNASKDRKTILKFLSGCKDRPDKVITKMKNFYEARATTPELFHQRDPLLKNLDDLLTLGAFFPLPKKPPQGNIFVMVKAAVNDPTKIPMSDVFKIGVMSVDLLMELDDNLTNQGVWVIIDLQGVRLQHAWQMTPTLVRKVVHLWQDCYPIRILGIDFVNAPGAIDVVLNIFRRFLNENLQQRLRTHGNRMESLHSVIEPEFLPEEYGGKLGPQSVIIDAWKRKMHTYRRWFLEDQTVL